MTPKPLSIALAAALLGLTSQAQALDERWYLAPTLGYINPDERMNTGEDVGLGLAIGKPLDERWNVELGVRGHNLDRDVGNNMKQRSMGIDGLYFFDRDPGFAPFALIGAGYLRSSLPGVSDNGFSANIGLGFLKQVSDNLALRADARYRWSETDMLGRGLQNDDWLVNLGLHIPLGAKPIKTAAAPSQAFAEPSAPLLQAAAAPAEPANPAPAAAAPVEPASPAPVAITPAEPVSPAPVAVAPTEPASPAPAAVAPTEPVSPAPVAAVPAEPANPAPAAAAPAEPASPAPAAVAPAEPASPMPATAAPVEATAPAEAAAVSNKLEPVVASPEPAPVVSEPTKALAEPAVVAAQSVTPSPEAVVTAPAAAIAPEIAPSQAAASAAPLDSDADGIVDSLDNCPATPAGRTVNPLGCEIDSDGDGVVDALDTCPATPAGRAVNRTGCEPDGDADGIVDSLDNCPATPLGRTVNPLGCEIDSDGDGIVDALDKCLGTLAGRVVNADGCELDADGDGIVDALDKCAATPAGDKVDEKGCTLSNSITLKGVNFDSDSSRLRPESQAVLDKAAEILKRYPHIQVEVAGHTDSTYTDDYNKRLSEERAKSVCDYFIQKGVEAQRLRAKGYGETKPLADNASKAGRANNRRVELQLQPE